MEVEYGCLRKLIQEIFTSRGVEAPAASILGQELADATFAGYESHGIGRVKSYVDALEKGNLRPGAHLEILRKTPATAVLDGGLGFGILMALEAAELVSRMALRTGVGAVSLRNCGDVARLAPYARRIALEGCLGLVAANDAGAGMVVAPHGGTGPLLSTNPIAAGIPRRDHPPLVFDLATSQIALGSARAAARRGGSLPEDTLIGPEGETQVDPGALFSGLAALLPLGGRHFGHKGTALGILVDILAGGLSGDGLSGDFPERHGRNAIFLLALDPAAFAAPETFQADVEAFLSRIRAQAPRPGLPPVRVPGERDPAPERLEILDGLWNELLTLRDDAAKKGCP